MVFSEPSSPVASLGIFLLAIYVFMAYGRIVEILPPAIGTSVPIMPIVMVLVLMAAVLTNGIWRFRSHPAVLCFVAYYGWMVLCVPFSIWRGGSVSIVIYQLKMALLFVAIASLVRTTAHLRTLMVAIAVSTVILVLVGNSVSENIEYRFQFEAGSLSNPNELANHLLIGLPLAWIIGLRSGTFSFKNLVRWTILIASFIMLFKTGSRGGLVITLGLLTGLFLTLSFANKVKLLIVSALGVLFMLTVAPQTVLQRYRTLISSDVGPGEAIQSRASRSDLLWGSISITLRNPIFGVGPANFVVAYNDDLKEAGLHHHWEATHNAYTQISSEMGIPALAFYVSVFVIAIRRVWAVRRTAKQIPQLHYLYKIASLVLLSIAAYLLSGLTTSNAHQFYFPLLAGIALMVDYCGNNDIRAFQAAQTGVVQTPAPVYNFHPTSARRPLPGLVR